MAAFQQHIHDKTHPILQIQRKSKRHKANVLYEDLTIPVPTKKHIENPNYLNMTVQDVLQQYCQSDLVWCLLKCLCNNSENEASNILSSFYLKSSAHQYKYFHHSDNEIQNNEINCTGGHTEPIKFFSFIAPFQGDVAER